MENNQKEPKLKKLSVKEVDELKKEGNEILDLSSKYSLINILF